MIFDGFRLLAGAISAAGAIAGQAVNGAGTFVSTNSMGVLALDGDNAEHMVFEISVLTAPTVGTSVTFQVIQADDAALTTNVQVINSTAAFPITSLPAGSLISLAWTPLETAKRYVGLQFVNVGAIATASYWGACGSSQPTPGRGYIP